MKRDCDICGISTRSQQDLKRHLSSDHQAFEKGGKVYFATEIPIENVRTKFDCEFCFLFFKSREKLALHLQACHSNEAEAETNRHRPMSCEFRGKNFGERRLLSLHKWTERNAKRKFFCENCDFSANFKRNLMTHMKLHEKTSINCANASCSMVFVSKMAAKIHFTFNHDIGEDEWKQLYEAVKGGL